MEAAKHHEKVADEVYVGALKEAKISEKDIEAIAFSNAPASSHHILRRSHLIWPQSFFSAWLPLFVRNNNNFLWISR